MESKIYIQNDIHEEIQFIPDNSIDLIYSSPPYGITNADWDKPLDWESLFPEMWRILKPTGIIALHCSMPFTYTLLDFERPQYHYCWKKNQATNFLNAKNQPLRNTEEILIYFKKKGTYNPQMIGTEIFERKKRVITTKGSQGYLNVIGEKSSVSKTQIGKYPSTFLEYPIRTEKTGINRPDELMEFFIKTYSNPGDTVLDFTCHNDFSGNVCEKNLRKYIGVDINLKLVEEKNLIIFNRYIYIMNYFKTQFTDAMRKTIDGEVRKPLSATSIKQYSGMLGKLIPLIKEELKVKKEDYDEEKLSVYFAYKDLMSGIIEKNWDNYMTRKNYYSALIAFLEVNYNITFQEEQLFMINKMTKEAMEFYEKKRQEGNDIYNASNTEGKLPEKQKDNIVSKKAITDLVKKLKEEIKMKPNKETHQYLLLLMTLQTFPIRNELATIKEVDVMTYNENRDSYKTGNWIVISQKPKHAQFIFNDYKTDKTHGQRVLTLPANLRKQFEKYMDLYPSESQVFTLKNGKDMDSNNLSKVFTRNSQKHLGKNISTTILRKIYYGSKYDKDDFKDLQEDAKNSGHSPATAMGIYVSNEIPQ